MPIPSGSTCALGKLYASYCWKTKSNVLILFQGIEINFSDNLPVGQVLSNVLARENFNFPGKKSL